MTVYHFFKGNILHLTPDIIKQVVHTKEIVDEDNETDFVFIVSMFGEEMQYDNVDKNPYDVLFGELNYSKYSLVYNYREYLKLFLRIRCEDKIIFHSDPPSKLFFLLNIILLFFRRSLLKNCSFVCWGSDYKVPKGSMKYKVFGSVLRRSFEKYSNIITISTDDQKEVKKIFPSSNVIFAPYISNRRIKLEQRIHRESKLINVMVSHSGWPHNKHLLSFKLLEKYKGRIKIHCPLCYGDPEYIDEVIRKGKEIYADDFEFFKDLKTVDEYSKFMQTMDIYVSSADIQTGLGAVSFSIKSGTKIFVKSNLYNSLKSLDYIIFNTDSIENMSYEEFSKPLSHEEALFNVENRNRKNTDNTQLINIWKSILVK